MKEKKWERGIDEGKEIGSKEIQIKNNMRRSKGVQNEKKRGYMGKEKQKGKEERNYSVGTE